MIVKPIKMFKDNFAYLVSTKSGKFQAVVDPGETEKAISLLKSTPLTHVLCTHKHWDHIGNLPLFVKSMEATSSPKLEVYAGEAEKIEVATRNFSEPTTEDHEEFTLKVLPVPCHTRGHVFYFFESKEAVVSEITDEKEGEGVFHRVVFTGDCVFLGGCGRFFEGNATEMVKNFEVFLGLPDDTMVYCGHEYAVDSRGFSSSVDPGNKEATELFEKTVGRCKEGFVSIPGSVGEERRTNIFARVNCEEVKALVNETLPEKVMEKLREMKNKQITKI